MFWNISGIRRYGRYAGGDALLKFVIPVIFIRIMPALISGVVVSEKNDNATFP